MIFFAAVGFVVSAFLPWWCIFIWAFVLGWLLPQGWRGALQTGVAAATVWAVSAFYLNGFANGVIAQRMAELFQLHNSYLLFAVVGLISFMAVVPWYWLGINSRALLAMKSSS